ncbi:MAG: hypothetical protein WDN04_14380 [Rhodospirillales bacterium]
MAARYDIAISEKTQVPGAKQRRDHHHRQQPDAKLGGGEPRRARAARGKARGDAERHRDPDHAGEFVACNGEARGAQHAADGGPRDADRLVGQAPSQYVLRRRHRCPPKHHDHPGPGEQHGKAGQHEQRGPVASDAQHGQ